MGSLNVEVEGGALGVERQMAFVTPRWFILAAVLYWQQPKFPVVLSNSGNQGSLARREGLDSKDLLFVVTGGFGLAPG